MAELNATASLIGVSTLVGNGRLVGNVKVQIIGASNVDAIGWKISYVPTQSLSFGTVIVNATAWKYKGINATLKVSSDVEYYRTDRDIKTGMKRYLPKYYGEILQVDGLMRIESLEFTRLNATLQDVLQQFQVEKATWGLAKWESNANLSSEGLSLTQRKQRIKDLLDSKTYSLSSHKEKIGYECTVTEDVDQFKVKTLITEVRGEPSNIENIRFSLEKVTPAHVTNEIEYSYLPWHEIEDVSYRWDNINDYKMNVLETTFLT